jgi:hypothetical protein
MWPFENTETRFFRRIVRSMEDYILAHVEREKLISLYLGGRILTKDRAPTSDIEIFGIVQDDFNPETEKAINQYFKSNPVFCGGRSGSFAAIYASDLEGRTKGRTRICDSVQAARLWVKLFKHYPLLWGRRIDFNKLPLKELDHLSELKIDVNFVDIGLRTAKEHNFTWPPGKFRFQAFVKNLYHCIRMEMVILRGYEYDLHFYKLLRFLRNENEHIVHKCEYFRRLGEEAEGPKYLNERKAFVLEAEQYIEELKKRMPASK